MKTANIFVFKFKLVRIYLLFTVRYYFFYKKCLLYFEKQLEIEIRYFVFCIHQNIFSIKLLFLIRNYKIQNATYFMKNNCVINNL